MDLPADPHHRSKARSPGRTAIAGAASGAAAAAIMGVGFATAEKAGFMGEDPPQRIAHEAVRRTTGDERAAEVVDEPLGIVLHLAFGAALGAAFALVAPPIERRVRGTIAIPEPALTTASALVFAALVYLVSYAGWVPALGILPQPDRDRPRRQLATAAGHVVFGATLAAILDGSGRGPRDRI